MSHSADKTDLEDRLRYTKYYEHDGMLRAYANRAMVMAFLFAVLAIGSFAFAIYVRIQPPTVIRVAADGSATFVGAKTSAQRIDHQPVATSFAEEATPTEIEVRATV